MSELPRKPRELLPCPLCGEPLTVYGPEDWKPSFYDPDSGGDPYNAVCDCGFCFSNGSYDYEKFVAGLNRRAERTGRWIDSPNIPECMVCSECLSDGLSAQLIAPVPDYYRYCPCCGAHMIGGTL